MKYHVSIERTLSRGYEIEADTAEEMRRKAEELQTAAQADPEQLEDSGESWECTITDEAGRTVILSEAERPRRDNMEIVIQCQKVSGDQYFCNGKRLAFDYPWEVFIVNGDQPIPYYRVYIGGRCVHFVRYEQQAYDFLLGLTKEQAHIPTI